ncbi:MAG: Sugar efflux permease, MFS-like protein [Cyanobacteria bacterium RYN_339]|nr:Sugar efflux permease, MFS-like protein [Cyanobacteria bacterium RYN_339]
MKAKLFFLAAGMFTMGCDDYIVAGLLPGIAGSMHTTLAGATQGLPAFGFTYVFCAPLFAILLARQPARRVMAAALLIFAAGNVLTLLSGSFAAYIASRAIAGIGAGMFLPVAVASAAQLVEPEARGRAMGLIWSANSAGAVVGVPCGLGLSAMFGWKVTIGLILLLALVTLAGILARLPDLAAPTPPSRREQLQLLLDPRVLSVVGISCLTATGSLGLYALAASFQAGSVNSLEASLSLWTVGGLIGSTLIGHVVDRWRHPRAVMAAILGVLALALAALPALGNVPVLGLVPFLIWGAMGWATVTPQQLALVEVQPDQKATVVALNSSGYGLGSICGSALGGLALASGADARTLPYAAAGLVLAALLWQLTLLRQPTPVQEAA